MNPEARKQTGEGKPSPRRIRTLHVIRIPDAGHLPWIDAPERVVDEIEHFLAS
jgi:pimeloyl-ACP methyl ester carboxylesterase